MTPDEVRRYAVAHACRSMQGHRERWDALGPNPTDEQILAQCGYEFGISGGFSGPGLPQVEYRGGHRPALWYCGPDERRSFYGQKPMLQGKALAAAVREALGLGETDGQQMALPLEGAR